MKKFSFNLEALLSLRKWEEQNARAHLSEANSEVLRIKEQLQRIEFDVNGAFDAWNSADGHRFSPMERLSLNAQVLQLEKETLKARELMSKAENGRAKAMAALQAASKNRKVVSSLKEKRLLEHQAEVEKQERFEIEDIFNARRRAS